MIAAIAALLGRLAVAMAQPLPEAPLGELAELVARHDIARPRFEDIPTGSVAEFDAWLAQLDRHARRLSPEEYRASALAMLPRTYGLGGAIFEHAGTIRWIGFRSGPAAAASVPPEGEVRMLDRQAVTPANLRSLVAGVQQGSPGEVRLQLAGTSRDFVIRKDRSVTPAVEAWPAGAQVLVRLFQFVEGRTAAALQRAVADAPAVILDMRFSDGGSVLEAFNALGAFLAPGAPVGGLALADGDRMAFTAPDLGGAFQGPVTVLTSPVTASAAEVFVAALQHHRRARIVGTPTYGKCLAQRQYALSDGGALRLSVERMLRPSGASCEEAPIVPDIPLPAGSIFDTPWVLAALPPAKQARPTFRVCEAVVFPTAFDAQQRDAEIRNAVPAEMIAVVMPAGNPPGQGAIDDHRVCFGPTPDEAKANALAKQLAELLAGRFEVVGDR